MPNNEYLIYKKENLLRLVANYNKQVIEDNKFQINEEDFDIRNNFCKPEICNHRSGCFHCCVHFPCKFSPKDFLDITNIDYMRNILNTGLICIGNTSKDSKTLILRPRGYEDKKNCIVSLFPFYFSLYDDELNPCVFRGDKGCLLDPEYRPSQGLLLVPVAKGKYIEKHFEMYDSYDCEEEYKQYQEYLEILYNEYKEKYLPMPEFPLKKDIAEDFVKKLTYI